MSYEPRRPSWAVGFFLFWGMSLGCRGPEDDTDGAPVLTDPEITTLTWACDVDAGQWSLGVEASSWSGGGALWLTSDGVYVERHPVRVLRDEADGSGETLGLDLAVVSDWRDQASGSSTAFLFANAPAFRFVLDDRAGEPADCRADGDVAVWSRVVDAPACDIPWHH